MGGFQLDVSQPLYVGRAYHAGMLLPAKIVLGAKSSFVSWGGKEISVSNYEVLCDDKVWMKTSGGYIPYGALPVGSENGETLYIGRVNYNGLMLGKVHPSKGILYVAYGGKELRFQNYEILIVTPSASPKNLLQGRKNLWINSTALPKSDNLKSMLNNTST